MKLEFVETRQAKKISRIVDFLSGLAGDSNGRFVNDILALDDEKLEYIHDYIQWTFPLTEASGSNFNAPVLTAQDIEDIKASKQSQANLVLLTERMTRFFEASEDLCRFTNHNHLRVTRIIKSLRILHSEELADNFKKRVFFIVGESGMKVNPLTIEIWKAS